MNSIADKIKYWLSGKTATLIILLSVITGRIIQLIFLFDIRADRSHQMLATHSFLTGHGISKAFTLPANLSETIYEPLINWPPGYSLLLSPFYVLFNHNYIISGIVLDIFFALILIFTTRSILKKLDAPLHEVNLFTLLTGFVLYPFYLKSSSDAIAITLFLFSFNLSLSILKTGYTNWLQKTIGLSISFILCASMKFLYMPLILIIPVFLIIKGFTNKDIIVKKTGFLSLLIIFFGLLSLFIYQKSVSGSGAYIAQTTQGIFTENLFSAHPVIPASFVNPETIGIAFHQPYEEGSIIFSIYQWVNLLLCIVLFSLGLWIFYKKGFAKKSIISSFLYLSFFLFLAILLILSALSVKYAKEFNIWTYLQEARYYGLITILVQLSVFILCQIKNTKFIKYLFYLLLLLFLPEMFRGMLFSISRISNFRKEEYVWQTDYKFQQFADAIIKKEQQKNPFTKVVLAGSSPYMNNRISLYSHIPLMKDINIINTLSSLNTKTSVLLLVALRVDALKDFSPFLAAKEKQEAGEFIGFHFYTVYVEPH